MSNALSDSLPGQFLSTISISIHLLQFCVLIKHQLCMCLAFIQNLPNEFLSNHLLDAKKLLVGQYIMFYEMMYSTAREDEQGIVTQCV